MAHPLTKVAFGRASEEMGRISKMTAAQATKALRELAPELRAYASPDALVPQLAEQMEITSAFTSELEGRKKAGVKEALEPVTSWINDNWPEEEKGLEPSSRIDEIEQQVNALMASAATSLVRVGGLLTEAKEEYDPKETGSFLAWAEGAFGFKKAYVYRLMRVFQEFGSDLRLQGVPLNVLALLTGASPEVKDKARELADEGALNTEAAKELAGKPTKKQEDEPEAPASPQGGEKPHPVQGDYQSREEAQGGSEGYAETIRELNQTIQSLRDELREAREQQTKTKGATRQEMPSLPQFTSKSHAARLGLDPEEAQRPEAVREAFRGLVKAGYGSGHRDHAAIDEAREALIKVAEAV